jgi:hypothetical protein
MEALAEEPPPPSDEAKIDDEPANLAADEASRRLAKKTTAHELTSLDELEVDHEPAATPPPAPPAKGKDKPKTVTIVRPAGETKAPAASSPPPPVAKPAPAPATPAHPDDAVRDVLASLEALEGKNADEAEKAGSITGMLSVPTNAVSDAEIESGDILGGGGDALEDARASRKREEPKRKTRKRKERDDLAELGNLDDLPDLGELGSTDEPWNPLASGPQPAAPFGSPGRVEPSFDDPNSSGPQSDPFADPLALPPARSGQRPAPAPAPEWGGDPFGAGIGEATFSARPPGADPAGTPAFDPFGAPADPGNDPFAAPGGFNDPFAAPGMGQDPFGAPPPGAGAFDPFAIPPPPGGADPFAIPPSPGGADPFAPAPGQAFDPFGAPPAGGDPFGAPAPAPGAFDPFGAPPSQPGYDPFGAPAPAPGAFDPFGATNAPAPFDPFGATASAANFGAPGGNPFAPGSDPFSDNGPSPTFGDAFSPQPGFGNDPFAALPGGTPPFDPFGGPPAPTAWSEEQTIAGRDVVLPISSERQAFIDSGEQSPFDAPDAELDVGASAPPPPAGPKKTMMMPARGVPAGGSFGVVVMGLQGKKRERAAEVLARLRGWSKEQALSALTGNTVTVLQGVPRANAENAVALFQKADVPAKIIEQKG